VNDGQVCHGEGCSGSDAPQDNPLDLLSPGNLSQRPDQDLAAGRLQGTAGHVPVVGSDGGPDIIQAHPVLLESGRVHLDPDLLLANSQDPDGGDPWDAAELVSEVFGHVPERCLVDISGERDGDDREGRLHLADLGVVGFSRQVGDIVEGRPDVVQGSVHVCFGLEFEQDLGSALLRDREHFVQLVKICHLFLDLGRDQILYFFGGGARELGRDLDCLAGKLGEQLPVHSKVGRYPRPQDEQGEQIHRDRVSNRELDQSSHGVSSRVSITRIAAPSRSKRCPVTTRRSPGSRPRVIR